MSEGTRAKSELFHVSFSVGGNGEARTFLNDVQAACSVFETVVAEAVGQISVEHKFRAEGIAGSSAKAKTVAFNGVETIKRVIGTVLEVALDFVTRHKQGDDVGNRFELRQRFQRVCHVVDAFFFDGEGGVPHALPIGIVVIRRIRIYNNVGIALIEFIFTSFVYDELFIAAVFPSINTKFLFTHVEFNEELIFNQHPNFIFHFVVFLVNAELFYPVNICVF